MTFLAERIQKLCILNGSFTLRSGRISTEYFDKYRFESMPDVLAEVARAMHPLIPPGTQVLAGLEMGGIAVVTVLSQLSEIPVAFVRKAAKPYGTARLCGGAEVNGKIVLIVEDVVTSGGQVVLPSNEVRALGARLDHAVCVIDREEGGLEALSEIDIQLRACCAGGISRSNRC